MKTPIDNILEEANEIVNNRTEDKERRYGSFPECMGRVAALSTILCGKDISVDDAFNILIALKLSRESHSHKRDNMVDLVGYIQGKHSYLESKLPKEEKLTEEELEDRMKIIGQNGNDGLHYKSERQLVADAAAIGHPTAEETIDTLNALKYVAKKHTDPARSCWENGPETYAEDMIKKSDERKIKMENNYELDGDGPAMFRNYENPNPTALQEVASMDYFKNKP